jgi:cytoskeleton protein RodZ
LEEVHSKTKIRVRYLECIESGDWNALPGSVYARGFIRSYAELLGLDGRKLLEQYLDGIPQDRLADNQEKMSVNTATPSPQKSAGLDRSQNLLGPRSSTGNGTSPNTKGSNAPYTYGSKQTKRKADSNRPGRTFAGQAFAVVAILVVLTVGLLYFRNQTHAHTLSKVSSSSKGGQPGTGKTGSKTAKPPVHAHPKPNSGGNPPTTQPTIPHPTQVVGQPVSGTDVTYLVKTADPLKVVLTAPRSQLWTLVTADGKPQENAGGLMLGVGEVKVFTAASSITFKIGNVPAAQFTVNGQPITLPNLNQTVNVTFKKDTTATP